MDNGIHVLARLRADTEEARRDIINTHYATAASPPRSRSALLEAQSEGRAKIYGIFGGQGNNKNYFDELRTLYATYRPLIQDLVESLGAILLELSQDERISEQYARGLDVLSWLAEPDTTPPADYLITAPLSFPLIGLHQLAQLKCVFLGLGCTPADLSSIFSGLTGHSQGIIVAAAVSTATTWAEFHDAAINATKILFWIGARCQQLHIETPLPAARVAQLEAEGYGIPTPMLSVSNLPVAELERCIARVNSFMAPGDRMAVSLTNATSSFVVSGPERTLSGLIDTLKTISAKDAQARVPFSQRKPCPGVRFLPITIPCHSAILDDVVSVIGADLSDVTIPPPSLRLPVNADASGRSLNEEDVVDLVPVLIRSITSLPVDWPSLVYPSATHIVDFGPGGTSGVCALTHRALAGTGVRVLVAGKIDLPPTSEFGSVAELFDHEASSVRYGADWTRHLPALARTAQGTVMDTRLTRLLGLPPVFVAGMTPTTTHPSFVAAVMEAGFHVEFAAGGYHSAESLRSALYSLRDMIPTGRAITLNVIYVSPRAIAWQIPLVRSLRAESFPITGLTVGGGVPSVEVATEYITTLGLEHISFKPGSVASIHRVLDIARQNPSFPIILQWTGGRGGGHHSYEDFHAPILETYAEIRKCANVCLVAGSGFGCADDVRPYMHGTWSLLPPYNKPAKMPFDGVLVASRIMTTLEACTSPGAKHAIAAAAGIPIRDEKTWEKTYAGPAGGVISVISEMGEPIHVVATRGALLWAELDKLVFSLDKGKRAAVLAAKKNYIRNRLNTDFQKPWFAGRVEAGQWTPGDLDDMTYLDVLKRAAELMFVPKRGKWIDPSYADLFVAFALRAQERLADTSMRPVITLSSALSSPASALDVFEVTLPESAEAVLTVEDIHYFLHLCRRQGTKPVPFVPALDDRFETWLKKDSLWQSEDLDAVVDQDAGRTFILHGPVAATQTGLVDEPVGEVLRGIDRGMVDAVLQEFYAGDEARLKEVEYLSPNMPSGAVACNGTVNVRALTSTQLRKLLAGTAAGWKSALFSTATVFRGQGVVDNPVWKVLDAGEADQAIIGEESISLNQNGAVVVEITKEGSDIFVRLFTYVTGSAPVPLVMKFTYSPSTPCSLIREDEQGRKERIYEMYRQLWLGSSTARDPGASLQFRPETSTFKSTFTLTRPVIQAFNRAIAYHPAHRTERVPLDFAIVAAWKPICAALLQDPVQGDLLALVHLSNGYEIAPGLEMFEEGETVTAVAAVASVTIGDSGKTIAVECKLHRDNVDAAALVVRSKFLFRGRHVDFRGTFSRTAEQKFELTLSGENELAVLLSKSWFQLHPTTVLEGLESAALEFHLETLSRFKSKTDLNAIETTGEVYSRSAAGDLAPVAAVRYSATDSNANAVTAYLSRCGTTLTPSAMEKSLGGDYSPAPSAVVEITIPSSNRAYSLASGDNNPIHTSPLFASLVDLPGTITHGMFVSAAVRAALERTVAGRKPSRIRAYDVSFVGMVLSGDVLEASFTHESMRGGLKTIKISVCRRGTDETVLSGSALVAQPATTVVFTGQGSQEKGMGMDLYESSATARAVWDSADAYFRRQFGLSILHIVRENPKAVTVHFGGAKGSLLRKNYMSMHYESPSARTGGLDRRPIFPTVTERSTSFTHTSPNGLLFATQFAQPALTVMELAAFRDMQAQGVVDQGCAFAGHSLGEYAALAAMTDFIPFERLLYVVFCRGMTMQLAVERDASGKSGFGMVAVDPGRVGKGCNERVLRGLVGAVADAGYFVEIVNLNIRENQYVCAGDLRALDILQKVLDEIKTGKSTIGSPYPELVAAHATAYSDVLPWAVSLDRGLATVPLTGVDVPFHSSFLQPNMEAFRRVLLANVEKEQIRPERLVGKYIPNVTGRPFGISKDDCEEIWRITKSERVKGVLDAWGDGDAVRTVDATA